MSKVSTIVSVQTNRVHVAFNTPSLPPPPPLPLTRTAATTTWTNEKKKKKKKPSPRFAARRTLFHRVNAILPLLRNRSSLGPKFSSSAFSSPITPVLDLINFDLI